LRAGYLAEAGRDPGRIAVIDAAAEPEVVAGRLRAALGQRFPDAR